MRKLSTSRGAPRVDGRFPAAARSCRFPSPAIGGTDVLLFRRAAVVRSKRRRQQSPDRRSDGQRRFRPAGVDPEPVRQARRAPTLHVEHREPDRDASLTTEALTASDTGFASPITAINNSASLTFNSNIGAPDSTLTFFADKLDGQGAPGTPGTLLESVSGHAVTDPDSFSGSRITAFDASSPFSMSEQAVLALRADGSVTGFNQSMETTAIPEPATWAMLVIGFGFMAWGAATREEGVARTPRVDNACAFPWNSEGKSDHQSPGPTKAQRGPDPALRVRFPQKEFRNCPLKRSR